MRPQGFVRGTGKFFLISLYLDMYNFISVKASLFFNESLTVSNAKKQVPEIRTELPMVVFRIRPR